MTLGRYLFAVYVISVAGFAALSFAMWEPELPEPGWEQRALFSVPVASLCMTLILRRVAVEVPESHRISFWSYRVSNFILAGIFGVMFLAFG